MPYCRASSPLRPSCRQHRQLHRHRQQPHLSTGTSPYDQTHRKDVLHTRAKPASRTNTNSSPRRIASSANAPLTACSASRADSKLDPAACARPERHTRRKNRQVIAHKTPMPPPKRRHPGGPPISVAAAPPTEPADGCHYSLPACGNRFKHF